MWATYIRCSYDMHVCKKKDHLALTLTAYFQKWRFNIPDDNVDNSILVNITVFAEECK